jgi:hypothetical protein
LAAEAAAAAEDVESVGSTAEEVVILDDTEIAADVDALLNSAVGLADDSVAGVDAGGCLCSRRRCGQRLEANLWMAELNNLKD